MNALNVGFDEVSANSEKYPNVTAWALLESKTPNYCYYDIDRNGIDELVVSVSDESSEKKYLIDIFTFDGKNVHRIFEEGIYQDIVMRIYQDGIIHLSIFVDVGEPAEDTYYKISADGYSREQVETYSGDSVDLNDCNWKDIRELVRKAKEKQEVKETAENEASRNNQQPVVCTEEAIQFIRDKYNYIQDNLSNFEYASDEGVEKYYENGQLRKVRVYTGYHGQPEDCNKEYFYWDNKLIFMFTWKDDGSDENRLYYKDGTCIRYIPPTSEVYDNPDFSSQEFYTLGFYYGGAIQWLS